MILLTAAELGDLRQALRLSMRSDASPEDRELFAALFACWCHNPVATFSLCLLAQAYDVSAELVKEVAEVEISVGFLMQVRPTPSFESVEGIVIIGVAGRGSVENSKGVGGVCARGARSMYVCMYVAERALGKFVELSSCVPSPSPRGAHTLIYKEEFMIMYCCTAGDLCVVSAVLSALRRHRFWSLPARQVHTAMCIQQCEGVFNI